jgi:hypothetical protein
VVLGPALLSESGLRLGGEMETFYDQFFKSGGRQFRMRVVLDDTPDLSWIGEFSDTPKEGAIDLQEEGVWRGRGYYRYFNPANPEYARQDFEHMMKYEDGELMATGVIVDLIDGDVVDSDSLWGIETKYGEWDEDDSYLHEVWQDMVASLLGRDD